MWFFEKKSRRIPADKLLTSAETESLAQASSLNPEKVTALKNIIKVFELWGKHGLAETLRIKLSGKRGARICKDPGALRLNEHALKLKKLEHEIRKACDNYSKDNDNFPTTIDPESYHVKVILIFFGDLSGKRVLDIGCGKGRFLRIMKKLYPRSLLWGLDISPKMLNFIPKGISRRQGVMTNLPFEDNFFDMVFASQSLEHAVEVENAVMEMCRVTKVGGKIVVIDKNIKKWGSLATPHWEKWFGQKEVESMFRKYCSNVSSEIIPYTEGQKPDGLFIAWKAIR